MQKTSLKQTVAEILAKRFTQISEAHCGPAVLQMLLANVGVIVSQEDITKAACAENSIELHGTRPDQLAHAVKELAPEHIFWYKERATTEDIHTLINTYNYPVGIEWQGLFEVGGFTINEETGDEDYGHYSIVTYIDDKQLIVVDPYKDFSNQDRIFTFKEFLPRWWDTNEVTDPRTGSKVLKKDEQLLFVVTPKEQKFSKDLELVQYL